MNCFGYSNPTLSTLAAAFRGPCESSSSKSLQRKLQPPSSSTVDEAADYLVLSAKWLYSVFTAICLTDLVVERSLGFVSRKQTWLGGLLRERLTGGASEEKEAQRAGLYC